MGFVDNRDDIREFLSSRRARIAPEQAGLPDYGGSRRVAGLRRAEVAMIAGVSPATTTRLGLAVEDALNLLAGWTATPADPPRNLGSQASRTRVWAKGV